MCVYVCVCVRVRLCLCVCMRARVCVRAWVGVYGDVRAFGVGM